MSIRFDEVVPVFEEKGYIYGDCVARVREMITHERELNNNDNLIQVNKKNTQFLKPTPLLITPSTGPNIPASFINQNEP